jgi:hypothetical protein
MFSVAPATFGVPAPLERCEGGRRSATRRIRRGELTPLSPRAPGFLKQRKKLDNFDAL